MRFPVGGWSWSDRPADRELKSIEVEGYEAVPVPGGDLAIQDLGLARLRAVPAPRRPAARVRRVTGRARAGGPTGEHAHNKCP